MRKFEFMSKLENALAPLKAEERRDILADFEEHFANGLASGKTEEEVARELGDPLALAGQYTEGLSQPEQPVTGGRVAQGVLAALGLLFFDLMIALPVIGTLFGVWVGLWAVGLGIFGGAIMFFILPFAAFAHSIVSGFGFIAIGVSLLALSVLYGIGMCYVSKWSFKGIVAFVKAHVRIIKGGSR